MASGNIGSLIEQMISEDIGAGEDSVLSSSSYFSVIQGIDRAFLFLVTGVHEYPFLYARIFVSVAKFSSVVIILIPL